MTEKMRLYSIVIFINLILIGIVFALHYFFPSVINNLNQTIDFSPHRIDQNYLSIYWGFHNGHPVFAGRPVTTFVITLVHRVLPIGLGTSFVLVNFGFLFVCGLVIYILSTLFSSRDRDAWPCVSTVGVIIFFTSFSILFAFFRPINTFDEPIQYTALLVVLLCIQYKRYWLGMIFLTIAVLTRETSIFLYPGLILLMSSIGSFKVLGRSLQNLLYRRNVNTSPPSSRGNFSESLPSPSLEGGRGVFRWCVQNFSKIALFIFPLIVYSITIPLVLKSKHVLTAAASYATQDRWQQWRYNFHDAQYTLESFISCLVVLALPIACIVLYKKFFSVSEVEKNLISAGLFTVIINTPLVFSLALAQEARLFALPLIFIWPILGRILLKIVHLSIQRFNQHFFIKLSIVLVSIPLWYSIAFRWYEPTFSGGFGWAYQTYVFLEMLFITFLIVSFGRNKRIESFSC